MDGIQIVYTSRDLRNGIEIVLLPECYLFSGEEVEKTWEEIKKKNPHAFNGEMFSLLRIVEREDKITLFVARSNFKSYIGTKNLRPAFFNKADDLTKYCSPPSFGAVTVTRDGYIICGKRDKTVYNSKQSSMIPEGYLNEQDITNSGKNISFETALKREAQEEICEGLMISSITPLGAVYATNDSRQLQFSFVILVKNTRREILEQRKKSSVDEDEISSVFFIENTTDAIEWLLQECELTPHNLGKGVLYKDYLSKL